MRIYNLLRIFLLCLCVFFVTGQSHAKPKYLFKVASIAPDGSIWAKRFQSFAQEVEKKSNGEIGFKIYPGGVMGDDLSMYRKMQIGQLHGGGFTMTGIGPVVPDFRIMGIPFLFRSYEEVDAVRKGLVPHFEKAFAEKGLELIALSEVGFVYSMSTKPLIKLDDLVQSKSWVPKDDPISSTFLNTIGITPIPLSIPDVLTSLQTGLVETVYNSLYGSIVLQWFTKAKYISDIPFAYAYGAMLMDRKKFSKLPAKYASMMKSTAKKHFELMITDTRKSNEEARQVLKDNNVTFNLPAQGEADNLSAKRDETVQLIQGKAFSSGIHKVAMKLLTDFRAGKSSPATSQ